MTEEAHQARAVTLDEFVSLNAAFETGLPHEVILRDAGLTPADWAAAQERWLFTLAVQAERGDLRALRRFLDRVTVEMRAAAKNPRRPRKPVDGPLPLPPAAILSPLAAVAELAPLPGDPRPPAPPVDAVITQELPPSLVAELPSAVLPFTPPASIVVPQGSPPPAGRLPFKAPDDAAVTQDLAPLLAAVLPFTPPASLDVTIVPQGRPPAAVLPFTPPASLDVTIVPQGRPSAAVLPFTPASPGGSVGRRPDRAGPSPGVPPAPPCQRWTLPDYANLCAGVRAHPTHVPWIQSIFALTPAHWTALHAFWQQRFQQDPALRAEWQRLIDERLPYWKHR